MKILIKLIAVVLVLAIIAAIGLAIVTSTVKNELGIDLFKTIRELKKLGEEVDVKALAPNAFSDEDMVDVMALVNASVEDMISYSETDGYSINLDKLSGEMKGYVRLNDRQLGAIANEMVKQELDGKIALGQNNVGVSVVQLDIDNTSECTKLNVVVAFDISELKNSLSDGIGVSRIKAKIPEVLYVSSTVSVEKGSEPFKYTVADEGISVNNLTAEETADLLHILDVLFAIGGAEKINTTVGETIMRVLVGDAENEGIAYSMRDVGATDFSFTTEGENDYFTIDIEKDLTELN